MCENNIVDVECSAVEEFIRKGDIIPLLGCFKELPFNNINYLLSESVFMTSFKDDGKDSIVSKFDSKHGALPSVISICDGGNDSNRAIWVRTIISLFDEHRNRIKFADRFDSIAIIRSVNLGNLYTWAIGLKKAVSDYRLYGDGTVRSDEYDGKLTRDITLFKCASVLFKSELPNQLHENVEEIIDRVDDFLNLFNNIFGDAYNDWTSRDRLNYLVDCANGIIENLTNITSARPCLINI